MHLAFAGYNVFLRAFARDGTRDFQILASALPGIRRGTQVTDYGDGIGTGTKDVWGGLYCDAANGYKRFSG
jgi:hypothetical protein